MKKLFTLLTAILTAGSALAATTFSTNVTVNTAIPDNDPNGLASGFTVSGLFGTASNVVVDLNISGGYNGDLYAYLTGPGGFAVLLNRSGLSSVNADGYGETGFNVTFQADGTDIHGYGEGAFITNGLGQVTGTWGVDGRTDSPLSAGAFFDTALREALLESFNDVDPNSVWGIFIGDYSAGDISTLVNYSVTFTVIPEPTTLALFATGSLVFLVRRRK